MNFVINNTTEVTALANELINNGSSSSAYIDELNEILNTTLSYWEESQSDAQAFRTQLLNEVSFANRSITCNNAFANSIKEYIEFTEKTSSKSATSSQI